MVADTDWPGRNGDSGCSTTMRTGAARVSRFDHVSDVGHAAMHGLVCARAGDHVHLVTRVDGAELSLEDGELDPNSAQIGHAKRGQRGFHGLTPSHVAFDSRGPRSGS